MAMMMMMMMMLVMMMVMVVVVVVVAAVAVVVAVVAGAVVAILPLLQSVLFNNDDRWYGMLLMLAGLAIAWSHDPYDTDFFSRVTPPSWAHGSTPRHRADRPEACSAASTGTSPTPSPSTASNKSVYACDHPQSIIESYSTRATAVLTPSVGFRFGV